MKVYREMERVRRVVNVKGENDDAKVARRIRPAFPTPKYPRPDCGRECVRYAAGCTSIDSTSRAQHIRTHTSAFALTTPLLPADFGFLSLQTKSPARPSNAQRCTTRAPDYTTGLNPHSLFDTYHNFRPNILPRLALDINLTIPHTLHHDHDSTAKSPDQDQITVLVLSGQPLPSHSLARVSCFIPPITIPIP